MSRHGKEPASSVDNDIVTSLSMRSPGRTRKRTGIGVPLLERKPAQFLPGPIEEFRGALVARKKADALMAWGKTDPEDRAAFAGYNDLDADLRLMVDVLGTQTIAIMAALGKTFAGRTALAARILAASSGQWVDALTRGGDALWQSFLAAMPDRNGITDKQVKAWGRYVYMAQSKTGAKAAFERVYPPLADASYDATRLQTTPWTVDAIHRLYRALSDRLIVAHVQMAVDFYLGTVYEGKELDYAFWTTFSRHIVIPANTAKASRSDAQKPESMRGYHYFEGAVSHEVGHAVGDTQGGHTWAETYDYVDWKKGLDVDTWSKNLWGDDAALTAAAQSKMPAGKTALNAKQARLFLANDLRGQEYSAISDKYETKEDVSAACRAQYNDQRLTKYWERVGKREPENAYRFRGTNNIANGRVWVYLTRGGMGYSSYKQSAFDTKVSWYSVSSSQEWFAENYEHYYRTTPRGTKNDPGTKSKLDSLHAAKARAGGARDPAAGGPAAEPAPHRLPFSW